MNHSEPVASEHLNVLDGWRAASITFVLAGHWLPLGPSRWQLNAATAAAGMALFFTLSGFLIVRALLIDPRAQPFLVRRFFRIVPLAWTAIAILFLVGNVSLPELVSNLLFVSNLPPDHLVTGGHHLWSLCVEAQFYVAVAILAALIGRRGLWLVPIAGVAVTLLRIQAHQPISIVTWHRIDEILAGGTLSLLVYRTRLLNRFSGVPRFVTILLLLLTVLSTSAVGGALGYLRPYLAAAAVGSSLIAMPDGMRRLWCSKAARYVAQVSYAVYVIHGMLTDTWLGTGEKTAKYLKRPLLLASTMVLAHISTFFLEAPAIRVGKKLAGRWASPTAL